MRILIEEYQYSVADENRRSDLKVASRLGVTPL